jgi:transketolase
MGSSPESLAERGTAAAHVSPAAVRRTVLEMLHRSGASHLGSSLSAVEILIAVYGACDLDRIRAHDPGRDRVFVSKGHAAAATYATLFHLGLLEADAIATYHRDGSRLAGHVSHAVPGVEHSTGALGHGLPVAVGAALGLRSRGFTTASVYCVLGDGEIQEGSVWEALLLARHQHLERLIPIVDNNRISSIRPTREVLDLEPLGARFGGLGFDVLEVDGHDVRAIRAAIDRIHRAGRPSVIIAHTTKGKGVAFAEDQPIWHYRSLDEHTFRDAVAALDRAEP